MNMNTKQQKTFYEINLMVPQLALEKFAAALKYSEKLRTIKQFSS